jgi:hypothetical protein
MSKTKSRAAYLRAYRARTATPAVPHVCPACHKTFTVERSDARYCSEACRAEAWRAVTHRHVTHAPDGWVIPANESGAGTRRGCAFEVRTKDRVFCGQVATWRRTSCRNEARQLIAITYRCDAHCPPSLRRPCDPEASCHRGARCPATTSR